MDYASAKCQESFEEGVKAGIEGYKKTLIEHNEMFSSLKMKCKDCGATIYATPENGVLEIPACTRCKMSEFERGVSAGVDNYSAHIEKAGV